MGFPFEPFFGGLVVWLIIGLSAGFAMHVFYKTPTTERILTLTFGVFGAFIGGMLGTSPYIHHNPVPLRVGGLLGAMLGGLFFTFLYHYMARKAV
jgi:uncharacterized membrane protein YeaQ/YmgE (transglycosylase-associated protein family)